ncbi:MAG: hypothetical protein WBA75_00450 [Sphingopyxis granuli]
MTRAKPARAEELRRHREVFLYAREHGLTLREAEKAMAWESARAAQARLDAIQNCGRSAAPRPAAIGGDRSLRDAPRNAPWMMRD